MERVDVCQAWEGFNRGGKALGEGFGGVLDFARVESSDSADLETRPNLCGKASLFEVISFAQCVVRKVATYGCENVSVAQIFGEG